ncbi:phage terminase large subunit family protein [Pseudomonas alkylphenolica]|uniref:Phage terminase large subunit family protein n=1 Tax=Pseudomonas alkylphenolica TaxID=237609 RepID=A0A6I6H8P0_9PSED|nr:terminase gpA endonuclease subunit [Pseudomonas alkylphenolica]QGW77764.1 phage terminase large subunit family protein [Pseudomonas alkylphenolica]
MNTSPLWMNPLVEAVRRGFKSLKKDPPMTASAWADEHFYMSSESSYGEGKWTTAAFQVALLNAMGNDLIQELNLIKSARVGYTKMLVANIAYKLEHKKRSVCMWSPTDGDAEGIMKEHVEPMIRDVPVIKALAPWYGKKHKHNTIEVKTFENRKVLWWMGGKAGGNYREKSPDEVGYDELSSFDEDIDKEGSPTFLGDKRLEGATYPKSVRGSTPKLAGSCQITRAAEESAYLLRFHIRCPHCQTEQTLKWGGKDESFGVKWSKDELGQVDHAWYLCESGNGCAFEHYQMVEASKSGRWICEKTGVWTRDSMEWFGASDKPIRTPRRLTFHIWTIYSTFTTWVKIADERVKAGNDRGKLKTFVNTTLGETWEEDLSEKVDAELLYERREVFAAQVPARGLVLVGGIDTQDDRYELRVWAFGKDEEAWLVYRRVLTGDPASGELLRQVGLELNRQFTRADGTKMGVMRWCWDSGGHHSETVRKQSRDHGLHWVIPIFGASTYGKPIANFPRKKEKKSKTYLTEVGTDNAKEVIYNRLKLQPNGNRPVPGLLHFPADDSICDRDELKQLTSETKKWVLVKGRRVLRWDASKKRNEALDCLVYALAALRISQERFGLDLDLLASQNPETGVWEAPAEPPHAAEPDDPPESPAAALPSPAPVAPQPDHQPAAGGWVETGANGWL